MYTQAISKNILTITTTLKNITNAVY